MPRKNIPRTCEACGAPFLAERYAVDRGLARFCSRKCAAHTVPTGARSVHWKGGEVALTCERCGASYTTIRAKAAGSRYCTRLCQNRTQAERNLRPLADRFWEKVDRTSSPHGCWLWSGSFNSHGYGQIGAGGHTGRPLHAHRVSWELHNGMVPGGLFVLHDCPNADDRRCVNPDHLYLGTARENTQDMIQKGRAGWQRSH